MSDTYVCAECLGEFEKGQSDEDAAAEALANFGVADPANCADMAIVCDDCYSRIMGRVASEAWLPTLPDDDIGRLFLDLYADALAEAFGIPRERIELTEKDH